MRGKGKKVVFPSRKRKRRVVGEEAVATFMGILDQEFSDSVLRAWMTRIEDLAKELNGLPKVCIYEAMHNFLLDLGHSKGH